MKYNDLLSFEPIKEIIKFSKTDKADYQEFLIKTFVFSRAYEDHIIPMMVQNLDYENKAGLPEQFGLQVVGNYGTGKSHLMSLVSLIAENKDLLGLIQNETPKEELEKIAGKFKVLRFELQNTEDLWTVISFKVEEYFKKIGVEFSFSGHPPIGKGEILLRMMAAFEEKYPNQGFLIVIDEMLSYLKSRSTADKLNNDLVTLQALGQTCDGTKFKFIYGVQEMIMHSPEFRFAAEMLNHADDRFRDILITKEDVAFIVKNRLLKKDEHQKQQIKDHLKPFLKFFPDMQARLQEYAELYPVHPSYFENFQKIKIGKSQRDILRVLSNQFELLGPQEILIDDTGLLTYEKYWDNIQGDTSLMAIPDVRKVSEKYERITSNIDMHFVQARKSKKHLAERITKAAAIKLLQANLDDKNGTTTNQLLDDLCLTHSMADDRDFLLDIVKSAADETVKATYGQVFKEKAENNEYFIEPGVTPDIDYIIKEYAAQMSADNKDEYYYKFLELNLPLDHNPYRSGFKIWQHSIEWKSHKVFRDGYIFFGNPNQKSTTQPKQHFYLYFMPIFGKAEKNNEADEVYFAMDGFSQEFKDSITLYGAAQSLEGSAQSNQKRIFQQKIDEFNQRAVEYFNKEYIHITKVEYEGKETPISGYMLPREGSTKEQVFSEVASQVLENWFEEENENYPAFTQLNTPITRDNYDRMIRQGLRKISNPEQSNKDGEGVLSGLGLWVPGQLDIGHSIFAKSILKQLEEKGEGQVLNRDEILECVHTDSKLWLSKDFQIEAGFEFLVLSTLIPLGHVELTLSSGKTIDATNLNLLNTLDNEDFYGFTNVKPPKGVNIPALRAMFLGLLGRDLTNQLRDPDTYTKLVHAAEDWAKKAVTINHKINGGFSSYGITIISADRAKELDRDFKAFAGFCDKLTNYNSEARIRNFQYNVDDINRVLQAKPELEKTENLIREVEEFNHSILYLQQAKQYLFNQVLKRDVTEAIDKFSEIIQSESDTTKQQFQKDLDKLKDRYAEWYLEQYLKYRISGPENSKKIALLNSEEKHICDILQEASFLSSGQYNQLMQRIQKLQPANPEVNKTSILNTPYHEFNPKDYQDENLKNISDLKEELEDLLVTWTNTLKDTLEDPAVKQKIDLLDQEAVSTLTHFKEDKIQINRENARLIRNAIVKLHEGLEKIELSTESLKSSFNKPLTPDEAITAFKKYIDGISSGKERDKIRIILK